MDWLSLLIHDIETVVVGGILVVFAGVWARARSNARRIEKRIQKNDLMKPNQGFSRIVCKNTGAVLLEDCYLESMAGRRVVFRKARTPDTPHAEILNLSNSQFDDLWLIGKQ